MLAACCRGKNKMRPRLVINHSMDMLPELLLYYHTLMKEKMDSLHCCYHGRVSRHFEEERQKCVWRKCMINQLHFSFIWCKLRMEPPHPTAHITPVYTVFDYLTPEYLFGCSYPSQVLCPKMPGLMFSFYVLFSLKIKLILLNPISWIKGYTTSADEACEYVESRQVPSSFGVRQYQTVLSWAGDHEGWDSNPPPPPSTPKKIPFMIPLYDDPILQDGRWCAFHSNKELFKGLLWLSFSPVSPSQRLGNTHLLCSINSF